MTGQIECQQEYIEASGLYALGLAAVHCRNNCRELLRKERPSSASSFSFSSFPRDAVSTPRNVSDLAYPFASLPPPTFLLSLGCLLLRPQVLCPFPDELRVRAAILHSDDGMEDTLDYKPRDSGLLCKSWYHTIGGHVVMSKAT